MRQKLKEKRTKSFFILFTIFKEENSDKKKSLEKQFKKLIFIYFFMLDCFLC